ncbi:hypothetical protein PEX1_101250 [Penicillium expansum]|uniref:Uncharacterized protein n=1 Tax=Penicillium expansum TaxID=27334 RepID=A0A0A2J6F8_PENEN|nr:hypothetical protein PEX2_094530 [Penicillium expansum]KGO50987.1 hypothetical protein PEX2_094530 [Penicillium expansum]KGO58674.1 hypothetical protein PEX1_101250 [Penicillium expansum]
MSLGNCKIIFALDFPVSKGKSLPRDWDDHWQFPHRVISNFDHPGSIARQHRSYHDHEAPGQKVPSSLKYPTLSAWMERQGTNQARTPMERSMSHWLADLQNSEYEACQARKYALDGVGCRPKTPLIIQQLIRLFFCLSVAILTIP